MGLEVVVEATINFLNKAVKPVMVGGLKLQAAKSCKAFVELADTCGYAFSVMPSAKKLIPEHHRHFIGTYWGAVSTSFCAELVESADAYIFAGLIFNYYSFVGYSLLLKDCMVVGSGPAFGCVLMRYFFVALAKRLKRSTTAYKNYHRIYVSEAVVQKSKPKEALRVHVLFQHIQKMLSGEMAVIAEMGNPWFKCQKLKLPPGCGHEFRMHYSGSKRQSGFRIGGKDSRARLEYKKTN